MPKTFIFMGVSGCGKSTIAAAFARATGGGFLDGDDFHPLANVEKMRGGLALDDRDRASWLAALAKAIAGSEAEVLCVACSALKKSYRDTLRAAVATSRGAVTFVYLRGSRELLARRHAGRSGHFMPPALLDSQLADLEEPEGALRVDIAASPQVIVADLREKFCL